MMTWQTIIGSIASILCLIYFFPYIITILQGKTKPNRASWWIWGIFGTILCISYYWTGAGITLWALVTPVIGQLIIAILSLKYGKGGWNRLDRICIICAGISLILWWKFNSPFLALLFSIGIDMLAALPTIKKSFLEPETEDLFAWTMYGIGSLLNLFTIENWSIEKTALPLYVFFLNLTIVLLLLRPKRQIRLFSYRRNSIKLSKNRK